MHMKQLAGCSKTCAYASLCRWVKDGACMNLSYPVLSLVYSYQPGTVWLLIPPAALPAHPIETQSWIMHTSTKLYRILCGIPGSVGVWERVCSYIIELYYKEEKVRNSVTVLDTCILTINVHGGWSLVPQTKILELTSLNFSLLWHTWSKGSKSE